MKMKYIYLAFILGILSVSSYAQVNATTAIPAATSSSQGVMQPDNISIVVKDGIASCTDSYDAITHILTIGGQVVTDPSFNTVKLTKGSAPTLGLNLANVTQDANGDYSVSYVSYVPVTANPAILITVPIKAVTKPIPAAGLVPTSSTYSLTPAQIAAGIRIGSVSVTAAPGQYPGSQFAWNLYTYANSDLTSGIVYITTNGAQSQMPAFNAVVTVIPVSK